MCEKCKKMRTSTYGLTTYDCKIHPVMNIHIETERLIIRPLAPADDEAMFDMDSDPEVHKYLGNNPILSIEAEREVIAYVMRQYEDRGIGRWAVEEKATGHFVGWVASN